MISFPCICGENWFCRRSVATFQSDVIQAPLKGPFCYDIKDQGPFSCDRYPPFSRRRKTSSQLRRNPFLRADISFSGYAAALLCPGDMSFFHSGDHLRMGPFLSFWNRPAQGPGWTLLISSVIRSRASRTGPPPGGRPGSAALFFLSVYPRAHRCAIMSKRT